MRQLLPCVLIFALFGTLFSGCTKSSDPEAMLNSARKSRNAGKWDEARIQYVKVLRLDSDNLAAAKELGLLWKEMGAPIRALSFLSVVLEKGPEDLEARHALAETYLELNFFEDVLQEAGIILEGNPADAQALLLAAKAVQTLEDFQWLNERLKRFPANQKTVVTLTQVHMALTTEELDQAESLLKEIQTQDAFPVEANLAWARLWKMRNQPEKELAALMEATQLTGPLSPEHLTYAERLLEQEEWEQVRAEAESMAGAQKAFLPAWNLLAEVALEEGDSESANAHLNQVLMRDPGNLEGRTLSARVRWAEGDAKGALEIHQSLAKAFPSSPSVQYGLAEAYLRAGQLDKAAVTLDQVLRAMPDNTDANMLRAQMEVRMGQGKRAIARLEKIQREQPLLAEVYSLLVDAHLAQGSVDRALEVVATWMEALPNDPDAHVMRADFYQYEGRFSKAKESLSRALALSPGNWDILQQLVEMDLVMGNYAEAQQELDAFETEEEPWRREYIEARIHIAQKNWKASEKALLKASEMEPDASPVYDLLVGVYLAEQRGEEAAENLHAILEKDPTSTPHLVLAAMLEQHFGNEEAAIRDYKFALEKAPKLVPALNNLAYLYAKSGKELDAAEELARQARLLSPNNPAVADTYGWALYQNGKYADALTHLEDATLLARQSPVIYYHLAQARSKMGMRDEAIAALRLAVAHPTEFPEQEAAKAELEILLQSSEEMSLAELEALTKKRPDDVLTTVRLAGMYEKEGRAKDAEKAYRAALELNPDLLEVWKGLSRLYGGPLQDPQQALLYARRARDTAPNDPEVAVLMGKVAVSEDNFRWAFALLDQARANGTQDPALENAYARAAYHLGRVDEARSVMQGILADYPDAPEAKDAQTFLELTVPMEELPGAEVIAEILRENPNYLPAKLAQAAQLRAEGNSEAALQIYDGLQAQLGNSPVVAKELLAILVERKERLEEATDLAQRLRERLDQDPEVTSLLAAISYLSDKTTYAARLLEEKQKTSKLNASDLYYLGNSYAKEMRNPEAVEVLQKALGLGLSAEQAKHAQAVVDEIVETAKEEADEL